MFTRLKNGRVLAAGGDLTGTAELYDETTGQWTPTGGLNDPRAFPVSVLLWSGDVLVTAGNCYSTPGCVTSELYHPDSGLWARTGSTVYAHDRTTLTRLWSGRVLVAGGSVGPASNMHSEIYIPPLVGSV